MLAWPAPDRHAWPAACRCSTLGWSAGPAGSTSVLAAHPDYVTCLAVPPMQQPTVLASAGLRAEVFVWDIATGTAVLRPVSAHMQYRSTTSTS